jgi:hypothetical protein
MEEQAVAAAALDALQTWTNAGESTSPSSSTGTSSSSSSIHPNVRLFHNNNVAMFASRLPPAQTISVDHVQILSVGLKNAAHAKVTVDETAGFLVLLYLKDRWQCISGAIGPVTKDTPITPKDTMEVASLVWDGYCDANGKCRGDLMRRYFHEQCRLTYASCIDDSSNSSGGDDGLRVLDCDTFCHMVTHRYTMGAHRPYKHWKDRAGDKTTLISIDFATPDLAMVMLKVGHPPFLWTDLLTCMRIDNNSNDENDDDGDGAAGTSKQWWIVHKSSCHEDFLPDT